MIQVTSLILTSCDQTLSLSPLCIISLSPSHAIMLFLTERVLRILLCRRVDTPQAHIYRKCAHTYKEIVWVCTTCTCTCVSYVNCIHVHHVLVMLIKSNIANTTSSYYQMHARSDLSQHVTNEGC